MATTSYVNSLMQFNRRVLANGDIPKDITGITAEDLKELLFFNQVFLSNTEEMFQKYSMRDSREECVDLLNHYIYNIINIIGIMQMIHPDVELISSDTFRRRLKTFTLANDCIMTKTFEMLSEAGKFDFKSNMIYYLTPIRHGVVISYIDPKRSVYTEGIVANYDRTIKDLMGFHKVDLAIKAFISDEINIHSEDTTVAVRVITNEKTGRISLVEFNGDENVMKYLLEMFPRSATVVSNPYLYTDDIRQMIDYKIEKVSTEFTDFQPVDINELFNSDKLIEFPKDSFDQYLHFLWSAANYKFTREIYVTLYRIGDNPELFYILQHAKNRGIDIHVNIELEASGEEINWFWDNECNRAGFKVTNYAHTKLKVHSKLTLIKFINGKSIAQIGTGNYHTKTTKQYTDLCLITSDEEICNEVDKVFKVFAGEERQDFSRKLLVTRYNAREELLRLIELQGSKGPDGCIVFKCNSLDDPQIIERLEWAASKGCYMRLIIRGVCTWVPQGYENVKIKSIVWDKLEHSRVYSFGMTNPTIYMGSLDLVTSKMNRRIETLVKIDDPDIVLNICSYLNKYITNTQNSWVLEGSGEYYREE